jgi:hypothetical protein
LHDLGKYSRDFQQYLRRMALDQDHLAVQGRPFGPITGRIPPISVSAP